MPQPPEPQAPVPQPPEPQAPVLQPPEPQPAAPQPPEALPPEPEPEPPPPVEAERPPAEKPREALLLERGAILLPRGTLQLEPSFDYSHSSSSRVAISGFTIFEAIVIGTIRVDKQARDIVTTALSTRYGLLDRLQIETRVPYLYRTDEEVLAVGTAQAQERITAALGLGDIQASAAWQALIGRQALPDVILRLQGTFPTGKDSFEIETETIGSGGQRRLKEPPTGSGFYSLTPSLTAVWRSDPVVFFASTRYALNLKRNVGVGFGTIDPGNTFEMSAGINIALSERVGVSISFVDQITDATKQNGVKSPGTSFNDGRLVLGTSIALGARVSLLVSAAVGLTQESPDFQFTTSLPMTFKLF